MNQRRKNTTKQENKSMRVQFTTKIPHQAKAKKKKKKKRGI